MMTSLTSQPSRAMAGVCWSAATGQQASASGGGVAAQGFTIRSEAVKLPRKLAAGSNRPGRGDLYQDD